MGNKSKSGRGDQSSEKVVDLVQCQPRGTGSFKEKQRWIGKQLRQVYEVALKDPVPDHLVDLLKKLDQDGKAE